MGINSQNVAALVGGGSGPIAAPFSFVNGPTDGPTTPTPDVPAPYEGWSVTYPSQPALPITTPVPFTVTRQGFDTGGNAVSINETMFITTWVRQPYANQALASALTAAPNDYLYSTDTPSGATNNSTLVSPKPTANWASMSRLLVDSVIHAVVVGMHRNARNGQQFAAVKFIATDGTTTVSQVVGSTSIDVHVGDQGACVGFVCDLDISTLAQGLITLNAEIYPWIGGSASVFKSVDQIPDTEVLREFGPRYFLKNTSKFSLPPFAYVDFALGVDATGLWQAAANASAATTASANPFKTIKGAIDAIPTQSAQTGGILDGCSIELQAGTNTLTSPTTGKSQQCACLTIEAAPGVSRAAAIVNLLTAWGPSITTGLLSPVTESALRFHNVNFTRTGNVTILGSGAAKVGVWWDGVQMDNGSFATWLSNNANDYILGMDITNQGSGLAASTTPEHRLVRGLNVQAGGGNLENWVTLCSYLQSITQVVATAARPMSGGLFMFNYATAFSNLNPFINVGGTVPVVNYGIGQNVFEYIDTEGQPTSAISADLSTVGNTNIMLHNNTYVGSGPNGRWNHRYDYQGTARASILGSEIGNIVVQLNTKADIKATDGSRIGNWAYEFGVGCIGVVTMYATPGTDERQTYPGLNAQIGTSVSVRNPDPLFTTFRAVTIGVAATATATCAGTTLTTTGTTGTIQIGGQVTGTGFAFGAYVVSQTSGTPGGDGVYLLSNAGPTGPVTATFNAFVRGAGNGNYNVSNLSPAKGQVPNPVFAFDRAGVARPTINDTSGAYVAP